MSNAKIAEMLDAALIEHAQRMRAAVDASLKAMASAIAKDIVDLRARVAKLEQADAPSAKNEGARDNPS